MDSAEEIELQDVVTGDDERDTPSNNHSGESTHDPHAFDVTVVDQPSEDDLYSSVQRRSGAALFGEVDQYEDSDDELEPEDNRSLAEKTKENVFKFLRREVATIVVLLVITGLLIAAGILVWQDWDYKAWITVAVLIIVIVLLAKDVTDPDVVLLGGVVVLMTIKIITPSQGLEGFSDATVFSVAILLAIAKGIEKTGALDLLTTRVLRKPKSVFWAQLQLLPVVGLLSGILNNTPVVAMSIPVVLQWSRRSNNVVPASKLLIPLSYASILGGTLTLIGTSTNLVVSGLASTACPKLQLPFFEVAYVGAPLLGAGLVYMLIFSRFLLPADRSAASENFTNNPREYTVAIQVLEGSNVAGKTVEKAGLRHLPGLFLIEIQHADGEVVPAPSSETHVHVSDVLVFAGVLSSVDELLRMDRFLVPSTRQVQKIGRKGEKTKRLLVEAALAPHSPCVGLSVRESKFRSQYQAAIIAVHRYGTRISQKIGDIVLQGGDSLLLETTKFFVDTYKSDQHFALVRELGEGMCYVMAQTQERLIVIDTI